jgi:hypothetical protein
MYFGELQEKLILLARQRIRAGLNTERGLARECGISQPHMHNLLKSSRTLTSRSADRLLRGLGLSIPDLLWQPVEGSNAATRSVPVLRTGIGPGREASFFVYRAHLPMPVALLEGLVDPVLARLAPDLMLPGAFALDDLVLLDQNPALRAAPPASSYWVIAEGGGLQIRALRREAGGILVAAALEPGGAQQWRALQDRRRPVGDAIRARVAWVARELPPGADAAD